nr:unnamed protein product [Spirometra erinaceieuropaei]
MALSGHNSIILFGRTWEDTEFRVERYDPDPANNEDLGPMQERLFASCIGVGYDVYVIGGRLWDEPGNETDEVDKFNVPTRRWTPCSSLAYPRCSTAVCGVEVNISADNTQRENGIIICGGQNMKGESVKIVELFIPRQNRMYRLPPMQASRLAGAAAALPDGRVFVAGGGNTKYPRDEWDQASVEFCNMQSDWQAADPSTFWQPAAPMTQARRGLAMAYFRGRVIAAGGGPQGNIVEVFSPPDADHPLGQWTLATPLSHLNSCSTLLICKNRLFAVGGFMGHTIEELIIDNDNNDDDVSTWRWTVARDARFIGSFYGAASALL